MVFACVQFPKSNRKYSDLIIPRLRINISTWSVLFPAVIMLRSLRFWLLAWEAWSKFLSDDYQATVGTWQLAFSSNIVPTALRELWTLNFPSFLRNLLLRFVSAQRHVFHSLRITALTLKFDGGRKGADTRHTTW